MEIHHQLVPTDVIGGTSLEEPAAGLMPSLASLDAPQDALCAPACACCPVLPALLSGQHRQAACSSLCQAVYIYFFPFKGLCFPLPSEASDCAATHTGCVCAAWSCPAHLAEFESFGPDFIPPATPHRLLMAFMTFVRLMPCIAEGIHDTALQLPSSHLMQTCTYFLPGQGQPYLEPINNPYF